MTKVTIIRTFRDGSTRAETNLSEWLAELIVSNISTDEPNTASARIVRGIHHVAPPRQNVEGMAWAMAGMLPRTDRIH